LWRRNSEVKLAIIIPALNEEGSVAATIQRIPAGLARQIIVVDNGSTDATAERARAAGATVVTEPRRGYGQACLTGLAHLHDDIDAVAILDADGADDSSRLPEMVQFIESGAADFVLSARVLDDAHRYLSPQQRFGNWLACVLMGLVVGHRYRDCGPMRVIRRDSLERLRMHDPTWGWNVEMQMKAARQGLRIREVPVTYGARTAGKSKISGSLVGTVRAGVKIIATIARHAWAPTKELDA
jgi:glycosyltransferase involved in cell wall biosynthesis